MSAPEPTAVFAGGTEAELVEFVAEQRLRMKNFRRVIVSRTGSRVVDLNRNELVFPGLGFENPLLGALLRAAGASFDPGSFQQPPPDERAAREFVCSARYAWGQDRIL